MSSRISHHARIPRAGEWWGQDRTSDFGFPASCVPHDISPSSHATEPAEELSNTKNERCIPNPGVLAGTCSAGETQGLAVLFHTPSHCLVLLEHALFCHFKTKKINEQMLPVGRGRRWVY